MVKTPLTLSQEKKTKMPIYLVCVCDVEVDVDVDVDVDYDVDDMNISRVMMEMVLMDLGMHVAMESFNIWKCYVPKHSLA